MVGFPVTPVFRGDTDDDALIHLNQQVGKAQPLPRRRAAVKPSKSVEDQIFERYLEEAERVEDDNVGIDFASEWENEIRQYNPHDDDDERTLHSDDDYEDRPNNAFFDQVRRNRDEFGDVRRNQDFGDLKRVSIVNRRDMSTKGEEIEPKVESKLFSSILLNPLFYLGLVALISTFLGFLYYIPFDNVIISAKLARLSQKVSSIDSRVIRIEENTAGFNWEQLNLLDFKSLSLIDLQGLKNIDFSILNEDLSKLQKIDLTRLQLGLRLDDLDFKELKNINLASLKSDLKILETIDLESLKSVNFKSLNAKLNDLQGINLKALKSIDLDNLKLMLSSSDLSNIDSALKSLDLKKIDNDIEKLTKLSSNFDNFQDQFLKKFVKDLPSYVPVYKSNNTIHFVPEFHNYLYQFIDNYHKKQITKEGYEGASKDSLKVSKTAIEELINKKFNETTKEIFSKVNNIVDDLNISENSYHINKLSDEVFINELLDIFTKGLIRINYADYTLGSRILGFLTKLNLNEKTHSVSKAFTGWFSVFSAKLHPENNANNLFFDKKWKCTGKQCSVGMRLFSPIIMTDVFIKNSNLNLVSLYIKPAEYSLVEKMKEYVHKFKLGSDKPKSKYTKKFFKVKSLNVESGQIHIKLPPSFVNLKIPSKDIYFKFETNDESVEMTSVKVFGVTAYSSEKQSEDFAKLVSAFDNKGFEDILLGDDDIL